VGEIAVRSYDKWGIDKLSRRALALLLTLAIILFVGTLMPGELKERLEHRMGPALPWSTVAHFALFAAIALLPVYGRAPVPALSRSLALAVLLACTTEGLQHWIPGRHPLWRDVGIDLAGALAGTGLRTLQMLWGRRPRG